MSNELDSVNSDGLAIGERLRREVKRVGGAAKVLSRIKATRATLYNWFDSGLIPATELEALASAGVDAVYVLTGQRAQTEREPISGTEALSRTVDALTSLGVGNDIPLDALKPLVGYVHTMRAKPDEIREVVRIAYAIQGRELPDKERT